MTSSTGSVDVLVIDDDADIVSLVVFLLEEHGLVVRTAQNGQRGYELAVQFHPRLVLSDLMMPTMWGDALYAALQADGRTADIPFVLMTAIPEKAPKVIETVVSKPIALTVLENLVMERVRAQQ